MSRACVAWCDHSALPRAPRHAPFHTRPASQLSACSGTSVGFPVTEPSMPKSSSNSGARLERDQFPWSSSPPATRTRAPSCGASSVRVMARTRRAPVERVSRTVSRWRSQRLAACRSARSPAARRSASSHAARVPRWLGGGSGSPAVGAAGRAASCRSAPPAPSASVRQAAGLASASEPPASSKRSCVSTRPRPSWPPESRSFE